MAGKTLVDGTIYEVSAGKSLASKIEGYSLGNVEYQAIVLNEGQTVDITYGDSIEVLANGGAQFIGTTKTVSVSFDNYGDLRKLRGKYWTRWPTLIDHSDGVQYLYYAPTDAQYGQYVTSSYHWLQIQAQSIIPTPIDEPVIYSIKEGKALVDGTVFSIKLRSKATVTITGTGRSARCYAIINNQKYSDSASDINVSTGDTITFGVYGTIFNSGTVTIDGKQVLKAQNSTTEEYDWVVPNGVHSISINLNYSSTYGRGTITVSTS